MQGLFAWLMRAVGPLVIQALIALGIGVITVKGVDVGLNHLMSQVRAHASGLSADMAVIAGRFGFGQGVGILFGAVSFVLSYMAASKAFSFMGITK